ncbi:MAG: four helix bundle protein [Rhodothermales bacterium]
MQDYRRLRVWQHAHQLVLDVYGATASFPKAERYGLVSQIRRAAVSVPSNIAEGCGRQSGPDLARFFQIALGSANEVDDQLLLARDLGLLKPERYEPLCVAAASTRRMLIALIQKAVPRP